MHLSPGADCCQDAGPERLLQQLPSGRFTSSLYGKNTRNAWELVTEGGGDDDDDVGVGVGVGDGDDDVGVTSISIHRFSPPSLVSHALGYVGLVPPM